MADLAPFALAWLAYWFMVGALYEARVYRRALARGRQKPKPVGPYRTAADGLTIGIARPEPHEAIHRERHPESLRVPIAKLPPLPKVDPVPPPPWPVRRLAPWERDIVATPQELDETVYGSGTKDRPQ